MDKFKKFGIVFLSCVIFLVLISGINTFTVICLLLSIDMVTSYLRSKTQDISDKAIYGTKVIWNKIIPFGNYCTMVLFGFIFCKHDKPKTIYEQEQFEKTHLRHEYIHKDQLLETGYVMYYILYVIEFLAYYFVSCLDGKESYRNISFEREARDESIDYKTRKSYGWLKYWFDFDNLK